MEEQNTFFGAKAMLLNMVPIGASHPILGALACAPRVGAQKVGRRRPIADLMIWRAARATLWQHGRGCVFESFARLRGP